MNIEKVAKTYALENALKHKGKASPGAIIGQVLNAYPDWKQKMGELKPKIDAVLAEVNALSVPEQTALLQELAPEMLIPKEKKVKEDLKDLARAEQGKVVMRIAPSPSGSLHLGHSYPASLNVAYCRKYDGKLILRLEDTNPDNIDPKAYDLIPEDMTWLYGKSPVVVVQSERVESYHSVGLQLLEGGHAYVCTCPAEEFRELVKRQEPCPCRDLGKNDVLERWHKMHDAQGYVDGDAVVRMKTDLRHKNPALRDFPIFRINTNEHPRVGFKYRVWPLMNLSVTVDDHELGLTHVLRGKDHLDNTKRQMWIYDAMQWKPPEFLHTGRINFEGLSLSASGMRKSIESGEYTGWDDIKIPTFAALRRRGYQPEALVKWAKSMGVTMVDKRVPAGELYKSLDAFNRELIEPTSLRYFFVANPKEVVVENAPELEIELDLHPDHKKGGRLMHSATTFLIEEKDFDKDGLYRFMDCLNANFVQGKYSFVDTKLETYREAGGKIVHWLPADSELVDVQIWQPDGSVVAGKGEASLASVEEGTIVQFERKGFARFDHKDNGTYVYYWLHR